MIGDTKQWKPAKGKWVNCACGLPSCHHTELEYVKQEDGKHAIIIYARDGRHQSIVLPDNLQLFEEVEA